MYDYRYKDYENLGQDMPMMDMPMMDMPMMDMPMMIMPMMNMPMICMPMMNMPMYDEEYDENDKELKSMYPKVYMRIYPMIKHHCDMIESTHGTMYCPSKDEMNHICKEVCDMYEKYYKDDEDDEDDEDHDHYEGRNDNDDMRQRQRFSRRGIGDLVRILFIGDLLGRRRRRRFFNHGFNHGHHHGY